MSEILRINDIFKEYRLKPGKKFQTVLSGLNLVMNRGDIFSIMGKSGAGKTTLINTIAGFEPLKSGDIIIKGITASSDKIFIEPGKRGIGWVAQDSCLWPFMTMRENIEYALKDDWKKKMKELVGVFGIGGIMDKYPNEVSKGEGKRVSIARAICSGADLLLMDEPFSDLDYKTKKDLIDIILKIHDDTNLTILIASHNIEENISYSDKIFELEKGVLHEKNI
jgi:iron(III) transport system ATP-binding protein